MSTNQYDVGQLNDEYLKLHGLYLILQIMIQSPKHFLSEISKLEIIFIHIKYTLCYNVSTEVINIYTYYNSY